MGFFKKIGLTDHPTIDWEMTPEYTFGTFESWGGKERVRSKRERIYYFFIDNWGEKPKLCLMERGIRHARVVAEIQAPRDMIQHCVDSQGKVALFERSFAINDQLRKWLEENIIEAGDISRVVVLEEEKGEVLGDPGLPSRRDPLPEGLRCVDLPSQPCELSEEDVTRLVRAHDFVDTDRNPEGNFTGYLVDNHDHLTVSDRATGLMWMRSGIDIMSHRMMKKEIERINREGFAGFTDWRLPTMAEAMSLMRREKSERDQFLHPCFSAEQPFIFVAATRSPGGYWFVDYKQGRAFWSSGTIPGGFGRLCRTEKAAAR